MNNKIQGRDNKSSRKRLETKVIIIKHNYNSRKQKILNNFYKKLKSDHLQKVHPIRS